MNRRNFLVALASPFIGRLLPKQEPSIVDIVQARMDAAVAQMSVRLTEIYLNDGRYLRQIGDGPIYEQPSLYWHGQPPVVFLYLSKASPWKTYSLRLS